MCLFVVAKHMRSHYTFKFRIKMRKEVWVAEQHPIKEYYIIKLHDIKHDQKTHKEFQKTKIVSYTIPYPKNNRSYK